MAEYKVWIKRRYSPIPESDNDQDVEDKDEGEGPGKAKYEGVEGECSLQGGSKN